MRVLIIGGAGFIGTHLTRALASLGHSVSILDNLNPQIHGANAQFSDELQSIARCTVGDILDRTVLNRMVAGQDVIVNLAAETGTAQSMYAVSHYERVNVGGTAMLMDVLVNTRSETLRKLVVASSRAIYGEGLYQCAEHGPTYPAARTAEDMSMGRFEPRCPQCGAAMNVLATPEDARLAPTSFYGITKQMQEQTTLLFAQTLKIDGFALRYQNVYGPGQSLTNPYTGLLAVFATAVRRGDELNVFEDGRASRDFVYIDDVIEATVACIQPEIHGVHSLNVGSATRTDILEVARSIARASTAHDSTIRVSGMFRVGDIRHNLADISRLSALTGFQPRWSFDAGLAEFLRWANAHAALDNGFDRSMEELTERGLIGQATEV